MPFPEMASRDVPELVGEDDADLVAGEAAVEERVPDHDSGGRPEPNRERIRLRREVAHLLHVHRRSGDALAPLQRLDVLAQLRALRRVDGEREQVRRDEQRKRREPEEDRGHRQPPVAWEAPREEHHDRDLEHHEDDLPAELRPGLEQPVDPGPARQVVPLLPPARGQGEREVHRPDDDERDHPDDHSGADRPQPRVPGQAGSAADEDEERDDRRDESEDAVDAQKALVVLCARELGGTEVVARIELRQLEIARHP